jgi:putative transposase
MTIAPSTFYAAALVSTRADLDAVLLRAIEQICDEFPAYGYRRITHERRRRGRGANHKRVARLMRAGQMAPTPVRRFYATTDSNHPNPSFRISLAGRRSPERTNSGTRI